MSDPNHATLGGIEPVSPLVPGPGVLPVVEVRAAEQAVPLAEALLAGGIRVLEITLRTAAGLAAARRVLETVPGIVVGIGTVLTQDDLDRVVDIGAHFAVSPGVTTGLLAKAAMLGLPYLPGTATPSDVVLALQYDCREMKFFPAVPYGGVATLETFGSVLSQARFCPTGGITMDNMNEFLGLSNVFCVGGSWVAPAALIEAGDWPAITARAARILGAVAAAGTR